MLLVRLLLVLVLVGAVVYVAVSWLLNAWLRLRKLGYPFTPKYILLVGSLETERRETLTHDALQKGEVAWARDVAGPHFQEEVRRRVASGEDWEHAVSSVLGRYDGQPSSAKES